MRRICPCPSSVVLFLSLLLGLEVTASAHAGKRHEDYVHRLEKVQAQARAQITGRPGKREASICPADYSLCPASLNGGCCPDRYGCAADSCYATTAGTGSACGSVGYYACGSGVGGGCCPEGYICGPYDCTAPAGVSNVMTSCPASYYLCPSSFNYGCCQSGLGCAANACYVTTPSTYTITETITTTSAGAQIATTTLTATTVLTPTPPTALPTSSDPNAVAKFIPTKVDKVVASSAPSGNGGSLTRAQIGGIIAGAVAMLIIFITLTIIIIKRLNRVAEAIDSRKESSAGDLNRTHPPGMTQYSRPPASDAGDEQVAFAITNRMRGGGRAPSDSGYSTSQQQLPTPHNFPSSTLSDSGNSAGYFDATPDRVHNLPGHHPPDNSRASTDSSQAVSSAQHHQQQQRYGAHGRHWSSASEQSANSSSDAGAGVGSPLLPAELDTDGAFIPELPTTTGVADVRGVSGGNGGGGGGVPGVGRPWLGHARRHSGGHHTRGRSEGSVSGASGGGGGNGVALDVVSESVEVMHGYYGPRD